MKITDSPQKVDVPKSFVEMGLNVEIVAIAIELFGLGDDFKILDYVDSVAKLQEKLPRNFPVVFIKYAKQIFEKDDKKVLPFLMEVEKARKYSKNEKEIFDILNIFDNDAKKTADFLEGQKFLEEMGFDKDKIKEALLMCNNDKEQSLQYCLENR